MPIAVLGGACIGLLGGGGALAAGFYDFSLWSWLALAALVAVMIATLAAASGTPRPVLALPVGLATLSLVQFASQMWAESADQVLTEAHRTMLYAAVAAVLAILLRDPRARVALLGAFAGGALLVAGVEVVRLLGSPVPGDFVGGRLQDPVGYANGQAAALTMAVWPLLGLSEGRRAFEAVAVAGATVLVGLAVLTQSRAGLAAFALASLLVVALVPGRLRRGGLLAVIGVAVAVVSGSLLDVYDDGSSRAALPSEDVVHGAVRSLLLAAVAAGMAWAGLALALGRLAWSPGRVGRGTLVAVASAVALTTVVAAGPGAIDRLDRQWTDFRELRGVKPGGSRLTSGGGNRYDYWRVAVAQFAEHPLAGIGAGNFDRTYFLERRTTEDVRQPHSLPLQTLAETGLLGGLPLAGVVLTLLVACARTIRRAGLVPRLRGPAAAAIGGLAVWTIQAAVDWVHLLPSLTFGALGCAAALTWSGRAQANTAEPRRAFRPLIFAAAVLATASVGARIAADRSREEARAKLEQDPAGAIEAARHSLRLDDTALRSYFVLSAAHARLGRYAEARQVLERAAALEPHDFLPPALLGDLATRRGLHDQALRDYGRAQALNPRDPGLAAAVAGARQRASTSSG